MTASRIVRGTKTRIFLYICAIVFVVATVASYLGARRSNEMCHQLEESLSSQLQVILAYKQTLEKSLKAELAAHRLSSAAYDRRLAELGDKFAADTQAAAVRFGTLQQHFNLLKTSHDDLKDKCALGERRQLAERGELDAKLKRAQDELAKVAESKEALKAQFLQLQGDRDGLQRRLADKPCPKVEEDSRFLHMEKANYDLGQELNDLRDKCGASVNSSANGGGGQSEKSVSLNILKLPPKSTTSSSSKVSKLGLDGAVPLVLPTMPHAPQVPEGVVPMPNADKQVNALFLAPNRAQEELDDSAKEVFDQVKPPLEVGNLERSVKDDKHINNFQQHYEVNQNELDDDEYEDTGRNKDQAIRN